MDILIGLLILGLLAGFGVILAALFDEGTALRVAAILLARVEANRAYRQRYSEALAEREDEFGLKRWVKTEAR